MSPLEFEAIPFVEGAEPLLPSRFSLEEYKEAEARASSGARTISHLVDEAKIERANEAHRMLTNLVAARIRRAGAIPRCNNLVDLAARVKNTPFIFEVKSTNERNARDQIRRGISQLYEYRYLQNAPDAQLVLVIQRPLSSGLAWLSDYLILDRGIRLAWDGDRKNLRCPTSVAEKLHFLVA